MSADVLNLIDGAWDGARSGRRLTRLSPSDGVTAAATFPESADGDAARAVVAARRAFEDWRLTGPAERGEFLLAAAGALEAAAEAAVERVVGECGLTREEATAEHRESVAAIRAAAGTAALLDPGSSSQVTAGGLRVGYRAAAGVIGLVGGGVSPLAAPGRVMASAFAAGNTVVWNPGPESPASAALLVTAFQTAGARSGAVNLVHGTSARVGAAVLAHPDVRIAVTVGEADLVAGAAPGTPGPGKRHLVEASGRGGMVLLEDADLDGAVESALRGAFRRAGQGAGAIRRVVMHRRVAQSFTDRFAAAAAGFRTGNPADATVQMGPLLTPERRKRARELVEAARRSGGRVIAGGSAPEDGAGGWFLAPTVLDEMRPSMPGAGDERPGPVVALIVVDSLEEAIHVLNHALPGLCCSVHTRDVGRVHRVLRDLEAPDITLNGPPAGTGGVVAPSWGGPIEGTDAAAWIRVLGEWRTALVVPSGRRPGSSPDLDANA